MKKQKFMTAGTTLLALTIAAMLAIPALRARAQSGGILDVLEQTRQAQAQTLEGSWITTVTVPVPPGVPQPPSFITYGTFARGGAFIGSDRNGPSPQHGVWAHRGGNRFAFTFKQNLFDRMGNFTGTLGVNATLSVTGNDTFIGVALGESRDAAGNLLPGGCVTLRGDRIKLEPLAEQCQSITPPQ